MRGRRHGLWPWNLVIYQSFLPKAITKTLGAMIRSCTNSEIRSSGFFAASSAIAVFSLAMINLTLSFLPLSIWLLLLMHLCEHYLNTLLPLISAFSSSSIAWTESWSFPADNMNSTGFPSTSTIACSFVFDPPLVRPIASSAVFPSVGTFVNLDAGRVQAQIFHIRICGQCAKYGFQCTIVPPFGKSGIHRLPGAICLRQFPPLRSAADDPKHPIEHISIIFPRSVSLPRPFRRQQLFYVLPLFFCRFISVHIVQY